MSLYNDILNEIQGFEESHTPISNIAHQRILRSWNAKRAMILLTNMNVFMQRKPMVLKNRDYNKNS